MTELPRATAPATADLGLAIQRLGAVGAANETGADSTAEMLREYGRCRGSEAEGAPAVLCEVIGEPIKRLA